MARNATPMPSVNADPRWAQVLARDSEAADAFVFAVRTTRIYCRPTCPARHALPRNVTFFDTAADAEQAGYRACLRCRPNQHVANDANAVLVEAACRLIEAAEETPTLDALAGRAGLSPFHFHRVFKAATGLTPKAYGAAHRTRQVRDALARSATVTQAIYDGGFNSSGRFYEKADAMLGMTPSAFRAGGTAATIRFALGQCSLGSILVAVSEKGICAILLGDDPETLLRDLEERFPQATLIGDDAGFGDWVAKVVGLVEAPAVGLALPLDIRGTAFQQRVWQALREIPSGETASYTHVAARIGAPRAVRAVAQACAANPLAVAIPCHRVVRSDGGLSGYRWGVERKRDLLARERATVETA